MTKIQWSAVFTKTVPVSKNSLVQGNMQKHAENSYLCNVEPNLNPNSCCNRVTGIRCKSLQVFTPIPASFVAIERPIPTWIS